MIKRYPHLTAVVLSYVAAALLLAFLGIEFFEALILPFGLFGVFAAGMLYTYGFTASVGALLLVTLSAHYPPGLIAVIAGFGALMADFTILKFIKNNLRDEVERITSSKLICDIGGRGIFCKNWFRQVFGALILASPFPDEIGIAFMASGKIKKDAFIWVTLVADMVGIYLLVSAAKAIL